MFVFFHFYLLCFSIFCILFFYDLCVSSKLREYIKKNKRNLLKNTKKLIVKTVHYVINGKSKSFVKSIIYNKFEKENTNENKRKFFLIGFNITKMMAITFEQLQQVVFTEIKEKLENHEGLTIFANERAKFEGWLKVELVRTLKASKEYKLEVLPEQSNPKGKSKKYKIDVIIEDEWGIQLKTINTNYRFEGVKKVKTPITKNIDDLLDDIDKLRKSKYNNKAILFVVFPLDLEKNKKYWNKHVDKIENRGVKLFPKKFKFNDSNIPGVIYLGLIK